MERLAVAVALALVGCTAIRPLDTALDAGVDARVGALDVGTLDVGMLDVGAVDGGAGDVGLDAPLTIDAGCMAGAPELCNGRDDDCSPATADGSGDPMIGAPCDGADTDLCIEGTFSGCASGALVCSDTTTSTPEVCDFAAAVDEDCDGMVDESDATGTRAWYPDADGDNYGTSSGVVMACTRPMSGAGRWASMGGDCDDTNAQVRPGRPERCNAIDDDCNAMIDDGNPCAGCTTESYGGHTYQICGNGLPQAMALTTCMGDGYHLAKVEDAAENTFLASTATGLGIGTGTGVAAPGLWLGLMASSMTPPVTYTWLDGTGASYLPWDVSQGEPNHSGLCVRVHATGAGWADSNCLTPQPYVCEAP